MPQTILCLTDLSEPSALVLAHAERLAGSLGANVTLAMVLNPLTDVGKELDTDLTAATARVRERWSEELRKFAASHDFEAEVTIPVQQRTEDTTAAIVRTAKEIGASLVAMHSRGANSALRHAILGSVALGVAGELHVPVMLTGNQVKPPADSGPYHLLIATDSGPAAKPMLDQVAPLLGRGDGFSATLLSVNQTKPGSAEREQLADRLVALKDGLGSDVNVDVVMEETQNPSSVDEAILAAAKARGSDAIAMATHGQRSIRHLFQGSVALDVLAKSPVPVLITTVN